MSDIKIERLRELVKAITGNKFDEGEFSMRVPAEPDRDADLVISWAADRIEELEAVVDVARRWEAGPPTDRMAAFKELIQAVRTLK